VALKFEGHSVIRCSEIIKGSVLRKFFPKKLYNHGEGKMTTTEEREEEKVMEKVAEMRNIVIVGIFLLFVVGGGKLIYFLLN